MKFHLQNSEWSSMNRTKNWQRIKGTQKGKGYKVKIVKWDLNFGDYGYKTTKKQSERNFGNESEKENGESEEPCNNLFIFLI